MCACRLVRLATVVACSCVLRKVDSTFFDFLNRMAHGCAHHAWLSLSELNTLHALRYSSEYFEQSVLRYIFPRSIDG